MCETSCCFLRLFPHEFRCMPINRKRSRKQPINKNATQKSDARHNCEMHTHWPIECVEPAVGQTKGATTFEDNQTTTPELSVAPWPARATSRARMAMATIPQNKRHACAKAPNRRTQLQGHESPERALSASPRNAEAAANITKNAPQLGPQQGVWGRRRSARQGANQAPSPRHKHIPAQIESERNAPHRTLPHAHVPQCNTHNLTSTLSHKEKCLRARRWGILKTNPLR